MGQNYLEDERKTILINEGFGFENLSQLRELYIERISINCKQSEIKKSRKNGIHLNYFNSYFQFRTS